MLFISLFKESIYFALTALRVNRLRTVLSLLGVTIGIFAIIFVFTALDSLEKKLRDSVASLGDNVVFVQKWPWTFGSEYPWWKYINRPQASEEELEFVKHRLKSAEAAAFEVSAKHTVQYENTSVENVNLIGVTQEYEKVSSFELEEGRYFAESESVGGRNVAIIGSQVAEALFPNGVALGQQIKVFGQKVNVIGIFKKQGESIIGNSTDTEVLLPVNFMRDYVDVKKENANPLILVKAAAGISNAQLKDELTGIMRSARKLKPTVEDNFALNETSLISKGFDGIFDVVGIAGWFIGGLSILVGGFGIANIMFVSVRERTNQIGIQKSLGAKNYFILMQFLAESVLLCLLGGLIGLLLVFIGIQVAAGIWDIQLTLTSANVILSVTISILIGIISGFIPAFSAAQLDPVEAIRMN
ncbi:MAG TPA: ABC transporter permease [Bacteroidia bacterium]|jgi:putative ABC transport system permease protein|nr:ABC transporter permease [Bacteroidia bacterium]